MTSYNQQRRLSLEIRFKKLERGVLRMMQDVLRTESMDKYTVLTIVQRKVSEMQAILKELAALAPDERG